MNRQRSRLIENPDIYPAPSLACSDNTSSILYMKKLLKKAGGICLTERQKLIVDLYYYRGLTMPEIAEELNINVSTVSRHLKAARLRLIKFSEGVNAIGSIRGTLS